MSESSSQPTSKSFRAREAPPSAPRGLPLGQIALIISLNALISMIISVAVILVAGPFLIGGQPGGGLSALPSPGPTAETTVQATAPATATVEATAGPAEPVYYTVQPGDSLGGIATRHGVPLQDLMLANGLDDPDYVQVGQVLLIPVGGLPAAPPTATTEAVPTPTDIPFEPPTPLPADATLPPEPAVTVGPSPTPVPTSTAPPPDQVRVTVSRVVGAGDLAQEAVLLLNDGPGVNLTGWTLEGSELGTYVFPNLFLWSGGSIRVHTQVGANTASDLYWGQGEAAWPSGTTVVLRSPTGETVSTLLVP